MARKQQHREEAEQEYSESEDSTTTSDVEDDEQSQEEEDELVKRLEQYGQQFLLDFDDYDEEQEQQKQQKQQQQQQEEQESQKHDKKMKKKQSQNDLVETTETSSSSTPTTTTTVPRKYGPVNKQKLVEKREKVTVFNGDAIVETTQINSILHRSLDKTEEEGALSISDRKRLKRKRHEEEQMQKMETAKEFKKLKKGPAFELENNRNIARKDERQRELDQLTFDIKKFVHSKTMNEDDFKREMQEELKKQGKAFSKIKTKAINYKQLKEKLLNEKIARKKELKEARENGTFDKKKFGKELIRRKQLKEAAKYRFLSRHGAPADIGKVDKRMRSKSAVGTVGEWKGGQLFLTKRDIYNVTKKRKNPLAYK